MQGQPQIATLPLPHPRPGFVGGWGVLRDSTLARELAPSVHDVGIGALFARVFEEVKVLTSLGGDFTGVAELLEVFVDLLLV